MKLNLNNFFLHNLALKICPYCFLITTHHTGLKKVNLSFNFVDKMVGENIFKWSSLLLSILMIPSFVVLPNTSEAPVVLLLLALNLDFSAKKY